MRKRKMEILGTLGPACCETETLRRMFQEGMTGIRLNLSHTRLVDSKEWIENYHRAEELEGVHGELLIDMEGPELRIGQLEEDLQLDEGSVWTLTEKREEESDRNQILVPPQVLEKIEPDDRILLDDGKIALRVKTPEHRSCWVKVERGGVLTGRKSIKIVGKQTKGPALTEKDREQLACAKEYGVTSVMEPFVTSGAQLLEVRRTLSANGLCDVRIFSKIENQQGIRQLGDIIPLSDMIVIARGDLGNDMPLWELPVTQQKIADMCRERKAPFLVVTQMLASMIENPVPTRAEVSDIYQAVRQGADAVMVTNETAVGRYPAEVIRYLAKTVEAAV